VSAASQQQHERQCQEKRQGFAAARSAGRGVILDECTGHHHCHGFLLVFSAFSLEDEL
jgi:hypothetical protein